MRMGSRPFPIGQESKAVARGSGPEIPGGSSPHDGTGATVLQIAGEATIASVQTVDPCYSHLLIHNGKDK